MRAKSLLIFLFYSVGFYSAFGQSKVWTLKECIDYALQNNIQIKRSQADKELTGISLFQSKGSRIPSLNGSVSQNFSFGRSIDPFTNLYVTQTIGSNNFSLNSSLVLFNGFQYSNTIRRNKIELQSGNFDVETAKNTVILNVTFGYLQVLYGYENIEAAKAQMETTKAQFERTERLVEAGSLPEINLLKIRSQLSSENLLLVTNENNLRSAKITLMQTMELPATDDFDVERIQIADSVFQDMEEKSSMDIYNEALNTQPQIQSYKLKTESAWVGIKISQSGRYPRLVLNGNIFTGFSSARELSSFSSSFQQQDIGFLKSNPNEVVSAIVPVTKRTTYNYPFSKQFRDNFGQSIGLGLSIPILNNRLVESNIERAKVSLLVAQLNEKGIKNQLRKSIEQYYADMKAARRKYEAAKENLTLQELTYNNSKARLDVGAGTSTDFLVDKNNLTRAQSDYIQSKYEYLFSLKVLDFYQGREIKL